MGKILVFIYDQMADFEITFVTHMLGADLGKEIVNEYINTELCSQRWSNMLIYRK